MQNDTRDRTRGINDPEERPGRLHDLGSGLFKMVELQPVPFEGFGQFDELVR